MSVDLSRRLVPDELWRLVAGLPPSFTPRPQGGGTARCEERTVFTAVVSVLTSGCAGRHLPESFGLRPATAHRRFTAWTRAGVGRRPHRAVLDEPGARGQVDWTAAIRSRRRRPDEFRADTTYHCAGHLRWLRERRIVPRIARPGIDSSDRLGRHRWKIERSLTRLFGYRHLTPLDTSAKAATSRPSSAWRPP